MRLTKSEIDILEQLLGTLDSCNQLMVAPRLTEVNKYKLQYMQARIAHQMLDTNTTSR